MRAGSFVQAETFSSKGRSSHAGRGSGHAPTLTPTAASSTRERPCQLLRGFPSGLASSPSSTARFWPCARFHTRKVKACFAALARDIRMTGLRGSGASSPATENLVGRNASIHTRVPRASHTWLALKWRIILCHANSKWPQCRHSHS